METVLICIGLFYARFKKPVSNISNRVLVVRPKHLHPTRSTSVCKCWNQRIN